MFHAEGWDWPWLSWRQAARRVALWAEPLRELPEGARVGFSWVGHPAAVVLDLAIQAAGRISVPASIEKPEGLGCHAWAVPEGAGLPAAPRGLELVRLPAWQRPDLKPEDLLLPEAGPRGGAAVEESGLLREMGQEDLAGTAEGIAAVLVSRDGGQREIAVLGGAPLAPAERAMLAWATAAGAAVLLDGDPARRIATAAWARPTVFHGDAAEIARLRTAVEREDRSRRWLPWNRSSRLPFGRLRTLLATEDLPPGDSTYWSGRGVGLMRLPGMGRTNLLATDPRLRQG